MLEPGLVFPGRAGSKGARPGGRGSPTISPSLHDSHSVPTNPPPPGAGAHQPAAGDVCEPALRRRPRHPERRGHQERHQAHGGAVGAGRGAGGDCVPGGEPARAGGPDLEQLRLHLGARLRHGPDLLPAPGKPPRQGAESRRPEWIKAAGAGLGDTCPGAGFFPPRFLAAV